MNWNRAGLKNMARTALRGNYWTTVLVAFIIMLPGGYRTVMTMREGYDAYWYANYGTIMTVTAGGGTIALMLRLFLFNPLDVGCRRFFVEDLYKPVTLDYLKAGFTPNYLNVVLTLAVRDLFIFLWSLLFIVPGIVKAYEYRMVDYLLADYAGPLQTDDGRREDERVYAGPKLLWLVSDGVLYTRSLHRLLCQPLSEPDQCSPLCRPAG